DAPAVGRFDLLVALEAPDDVAVEVALLERERLLARRIRADRADDDTARQHAGRPAGRAVEAFPALDDAAVHVDDDRGLHAERREDRVAAVGAGRIVNRSAGRVDGRRREKGGCAEKHDDRSEPVCEPRGRKSLLIHRSVPGALPTAAPLGARLRGRTRRPRIPGPGGDSRSPYTKTAPRERPGPRA